MYSSMSKIFNKTNTSKFASDLMKNSRLNKFSKINSKNFSVISNSTAETKVKFLNYKIKFFKFQKSTTIGKYTVFDHEYDALVLGAGGAGLRVN